jgi:predicted lipoprotein with Yx(FWY)xxD motif
MKSRIALWTAPLLALALVTGCGTATATTSSSSTSSSSSGSATSSGTSTSTPILRVVKNSKLGNILVNSQGMTVYRFTGDTKNHSTVYGANAALWPPVLVKPGASLSAGPGVNGKVGEIARSSGKEQLTYNGIPLYTYSADTTAGQTSGNGVLKKWYVVRPSETFSSNPVIGSSTSASSSSTSGGW